MSETKYKYLHDCKEERPNMVTSIQVFTTGHWFWKKTHQNKNYEERQVKWTCSCGAKWKWSGGRFYPSWKCISRPEVWLPYEN